MSWYHNDPRPDTKTEYASHHDQLSPVEIGVIVGTVTVFTAVVVAVFAYRIRKVKRSCPEQLRDDDMTDMPVDQKDDPGLTVSRDDRKSPNRPTPTSLRIERILGRFQLWKSKQPKAEKDPR